MNTNCNSFPMPPIDLTGKLIIKAQLGSDIRKIPIHNEEITYDELLLMMQRLFAGKIRSSDEITIKYKDEDGDMITMFDSSDLIFAKSLNRYLKLTLFVNGKPQPLQHDEVKEIKGELIDMRDKINDLLSRIDSFANGSGGDATVANGDASQESEKAEEATLPESFANQVSIQPDASVNKVNAALFDPLTNQSESIEPQSASDPFAGVGPSEQSSYPPQQNQQQPPQQLNVYPSSAPQSSYNMSQNQEPKMSYPSNQSSQSMPMPSQPSPSQSMQYQPQAQNMPQQQQQQPQQQQQQQQQQYPQSSQSYQPQQQQQQNTQGSYASQGQQLNSYPGYPTSDPNQYGGQGGQGNPYRTMSPSQGRYPQPMQGYDYRNNPVAATQQISSAPNSLGYPGPGFK